MDTLLKIVDPLSVPEISTNVCTGQRCNIGARTQYTATKLSLEDTKLGNIEIYPYDVGIFIGLGRWGSKQFWRYTEIAVFKRVGRVSVKLGVLQPTTNLYL